MNVDLLTEMGGVLLSLLFAYVPGLSGWFEKLDGVYKRLIMLFAVVVVAGGAFGLSCAGFVSAMDCTKEGAYKLVELIIKAAIANQATYSLAVKK